MITIDEKDMPIDVAHKLITARKELPDGFISNLNQMMGGNGETDMFTDAELLEIGELLCTHARISMGVAYEKRD